MQVGLLNVDGYYNSLLALFDNGVKEGFIKPGARQIVVSAPTAKELMTKLEVLVTKHFLLFFFSGRNSPHVIKTHMQGWLLMLIVIMFVLCWPPNKSN